MYTISYNSIHPLIIFIIWMCSVSRNFKYFMRSFMSFSFMRFSGSHFSYDLFCSLPNALFPYILHISSHLYFMICMSLLGEDFFSNDTFIMNTIERPSNEIHTSLTLRILSYTSWVPGVSPLFININPEKELIIQCYVDKHFIKPAYITQLFATFLRPLLPPKPTGANFN